MEMEKNNSTAEATTKSVNQHDEIKTLIDGLLKGECRGVKGAIAYKVAEYAIKKGLM